MKRFPASFRQQPPRQHQTRLRLGMNFMLGLAVTAACAMGSANQTKQNNATDAGGPIPVASVESRKPVSFEKDLLPVFQSKCLACHSKTLALGGVVLESAETMLSGGGGKMILAAGKSEASRLLQVAAHRREPFMPPVGNASGAESMTSQELGVLKLWIDQGALAGPEKTVSPRLEWQVLPATVTPIYSVAMTPNGEYAACGRSNQIFIYHLASGRLVSRLIDPALRQTGLYPEPGVAHRDLVNSLAFSPDGRLLVSGGYRTIKFWRSKTLGKPRSGASDAINAIEDPSSTWTLERIVGSVDDPGTLIGRVTALDFSPDGELLATGGGEPSRSGELKIWCASSGELLGEVAGAHSDTILGLEFSPDGQYLATGSTDRFAKVFNVKTRQLVRTFEGHTHHVLDVAWRDDGKVLASCGADNVIKLWDFETGEQKQTIGGYEKEVTSLSFIGDSDNLLVSSGEPTVRLGERLLSGVSGFVHNSAVSADGQTIVAGDENGRLIVWKASNARPLHILGPPTSSAQTNAQQ
ncbi:MAG: hypothetical protein EXQ58_00605 [Acidobacteria bacterium]|nr:hypothetical protein [Acidobacteriota bacterium]